MPAGSTINLGVAGVTTFRVVGSDCQLHDILVPVIPPQLTCAQILACLPQVGIPVASSNGGNAIRLDYNVSPPGFSGNIQNGVLIDTGIAPICAIPQYYRGVDGKQYNSGALKSTANSARTLGPYYAELGNGSYDVAGLRANIARIVMRMYNPHGCRSAAFAIFATCPGVNMQNYGPHDLQVDVRVGYAINATPTPIPNWVLPFASQDPGRNRHSYPQASVFVDAIVPPNGFVEAILEVDLNVLQVTPAGPNYIEIVGEQIGMFFATI
jgi:hypothetical protein